VSRASVIFWVHLAAFTNATEKYIDCDNFSEEARRQVRAFNAFDDPMVEAYDRKHLKECPVLAKEFTFPRGFHIEFSVAFNR